MSIRIDAHTMRSNVTVHYAERIPDEFAPMRDQEYWVVSWLTEDRPVSRNLAVTALTIAELVAREGPTAGGVHLEGWAGELGLIGPQAVHRVIKHEALLLERLCAELAGAGVTLRRIQKAGA